MTPDHLEQRRRMLSDAFHTLNQPITGLHCGLEIALQKPRNEADYRQRISDGIQNAGAIVKYLKAIRQLVDAADPGERFGTVGVPLLLSQLKSDLEVLVESAQMKLNIQDGVPVSVLADPSKLLSALGGLAAAELESYQPGGVLNINTKLHRELLEIELQGKGVRKPAQNSAEEKLTDIRRSAAYCYIWTLGGDIEIVPNAVKLTLPIAKS